MFSVNNDTDGHCFCRAVRLRRGGFARSDAGGRVENFQLPFSLRRVEYSTALLQAYRISTTPAHAQSLNA